MTNAIRQEQWALRMKEQGFAPCTVWVPVGAVAEMRLAAEKMRADPDLTVGPLVSRTTGRLVGRNGKHAKGKP